MLSLGCSPASAAILIATPATWGAQRDAAQPGDTIQLSAEAFPPLMVWPHTWSPAVTIDARGATVAGLTLRGVDGAHLLGGRFTGPIIADKGAAHIDFEAVAADAGIMLRDGGGFTVHGGSRLDHLQMLNVHDVAIDGNAIVGFTADGTTIMSSQRVSFTHNLCWAGVNDGLHHPDCVQVWSAAGAAQSADVEIGWNQFNGAAQGADDFGGDARGVARLSIHDNDYLGLYPQAFAVQKSAGASVRRNHAHTTAGAAWRASVNLTAPNVGHCGNTADAAAGKPAWADAPC